MTGRPFVIPNAGERIGQGWRSRRDSLRLFTPSRWSSLLGLPFPAPPRSYPTKDEMADYLEAYAVRSDPPVRLNTPVVRLSRQDGRYALATGSGRPVADQVVVATGPA